MANPSAVVGVRLAVPSAPGRNADRGGTSSRTPTKFFQVFHPGPWRSRRKWKAAVFQFVPSLRVPRSAVGGGATGCRSPLEDSPVIGTGSRDNRHGVAAETLWRFRSGLLVLRTGRQRALPWRMTPSTPAARLVALAASWVATASNCNVTFCLTPILAGV